MTLTSLTKPCLKGGFTTSASLFRFYYEHASKKIFNATLNLRRVIRDSFSYFLLAAVLEWVSCIVSDNKSSSHIFAFHSARIFSFLLAERPPMANWLGVWHEIFNFRLFFMNQFPPGPWVSHWSLTKICGDIRKYGLITVVKEKVWDRKLFHFMLRCCWVVDNGHQMIFYFMFTLRFSKAHIVTTVSSPVSRPPMINYRQFHCYRILERRCRYRR